MHVYRSEGDLSEWQELFHFTVPSFARSFEYLDGYFYFGLGSEYNCASADLSIQNAGQNERGVSVHTGEIYSVEFDAFAAAAVQ